MAFAVRYTAGRSGEFYSSNRTPRPVPLRAGSAAYFAVLKYRCDAGVLGEAAELRVSLPGAAMNLRVALPPGGGGFGVSAIDYCKSSTGDAAPDPGNRVDVSAITESAGAAFAPVDSE